MVHISHERSNICPSVIVPLFLRVILILNDECVYRESLARIHRRTQTIRVHASRAKLFRGSTSFCGLHGIRPRDPGFIRMARKRFTRQARFKPPWKRHPASRRSSPPHRTKRFWVYPCLSVSRCRVLPCRRYRFRAAFLWARLSIALAHVIPRLFRVSVRRVCLSNSRLFPQASLFDCSRTINFSSGCVDLALPRHVSRLGVTCCR